MLKKLGLILFIFLFASNLFSQDLEYSEQVGNKYFDMNINYKVQNNRLFLEVKTKNLQGDGKGGVSISFPQFETKNQILKQENFGFESLNLYPKDSKIWNGRLKASVKSQSLLAEGWANSWKKNEEKTINLEIDVEKLSQLQINVRANLNVNEKEQYQGEIKPRIVKKEYVFPKSGIINEQSYASKPIIIELKKVEKKVQDINKSTNKDELTIYPKINEKHTGDTLKFVAEYEDKYTITYAENLKIWDKKTKKLVKTIEENIEKMVIVENKMFYTGPNVFGYISLDDFTNIKLIQEKYDESDERIYFVDIIIDKDKIILPYISASYVSSTNIYYKIYDLKTNKLIETSKTFSGTSFITGYNPEIEDAIFSKDFSNIYLYTYTDNGETAKWHLVKANQEFKFDNPVKIKEDIKNLLLPSSNRMIYQVDDLKKDEDFIVNFNKKNVSTVEKIINKLIPFNFASDIDFIGTNKDFYFESEIEDGYFKNGKYVEDKETLFLINNKTSQKVNVLSRKPYLLVKAGCYFYKTATPLEEHLIASYYSEVCPANTFYIISKEGKLLRTISPDLVKFGNNYFDIQNEYLEVLDKNFQTIKKYKLSSKVIDNVEIKDNKVIVYSDNQIVYYDYQTQEVLYTKYVFGKDTEITVLKEGFIDGKGDFEKYVHFIDNNYNTYTINQFYDFFYRPDLVKLKLQGKDITEFTNGLTYKDALKNPPPKVDILKVENQNVTIRKDKNEDMNLSNDKTTLSFNVQDNNGGVGLIRVYQEGKLIKTFGNGEINKQAANVDTVSEQENINDKVKLAQNEYLEKMQNSVTRSVNETVSLEDSVADVVTSNIQNKAGEYTIDLDLISGKNEITIEAFNSSNTISSYKESINIISNTQKKEPTLYAIVTGVNEFESNYVSNLKYSQNDAQAIKEAIEEEKGKSYKNVEITYLIGKDLTKENLNNAIEEIKQKAKLEDSLVFYISTHGKNFRGKLMLVPQNNKSVKNLISFEDLFKNMQSIKTLKQIFILDTCESGSANDIVSSIYDSKASVLAKSSGVHMLLATTSGTFAFEHPNPNIKHGVFTNNILTALKDKTTDKNKDKTISVIELSKILQEPKYIVDRQYPIIRNVGNDVKVRDLK